MLDRSIAWVILVLGAVAGATAAVAWPPGLDFAYVAAIYLAAHTVTIPNPSGRRLTLAPAVAGAAALVTGSPVVVMAAAAVVLPLGRLLLHLRYGRQVVEDVFPAEPIGLLLFSAVFLGGGRLLPTADPANPAVLTLFGVAAVVWFVGAAVVRSIQSDEGRLVTRRYVLVRSLADWPAFAALFSSAALYAITVGVMGVWSIPLAGLPYLFSHLSLHRVQDTRRTYEQTIRALGAIPEAGGQTSPGHSSRCGDLAVAVGAELGLGSGELRRIEYAALLHDIGRVVLANPAVAQGDYTFSDVSGWSAAIISEARYLEPAATIVASQHQPYRKPGEERDPDVSVGSQIVRIVARYDSALDEGVSPLEAIELLHRGVAYDYDPQIVMALRRVLERRAAIPA